MDPRSSFETEAESRLKHWTGNLFDGSRASVMTCSSLSKIKFTAAVNSKVINSGNIFARSDLDMIASTHHLHVRHESRKHENG